VTDRPEELDAFFDGHPASREVFDALAEVVASTGPYELRVSRSQVAFADGPVFARAWIPDQYLRGGHAPLVLTLGFFHRDPSPRWKQVVEPAPGRFTHHLELGSPAEVDEEVREWIATARPHAKTPLAFTAPIEGGPGGAWVTVPFDAEAEFGRKRVPVRATIDGVAYRGSLVRMGGACHVLGVLKEIRARIGKQPGDVVEVTIEEDVAERTVEVPQDLATALAAAPAARAAFEGLAYSHRREYVRWIEEAKRAATREARIARTIESLAQGVKTPGAAPAGG